MDKPTIPEVAERFTEYLREHPAWGSLHIVLDDHNTEDGCVEFCIEFANEHGDAEGAELATILLRMSQTQRGKLSRVCRRRLSGNGTGERNGT